MKKTIILLFFLFAFKAQSQPKMVVLKTATTPIETIFNPNGTSVWIYKDAFFKGDKKILKTGTYTLLQLGNDWNNVISSLKIPNGYVVDLYMDDNFKGTSMAIYGTKMNKNTTTQTWVGEEQELDHFWNDKVSSIKIIKL